MRSIIVMAMFTASLAGAAWSDYEEQRDLNLGASGIASVDIEAGAGSLEITGVSGADEIAVMATIKVPDRDADKAREFIESHLVLTLEKQGDTAVLKAYFEQRLWNFGDTPSVQLVVHMPDNLNLVVDDGSGSMQISAVSGNIAVEDGSGSITMTNVGGEIARVETPKWLADEPGAIDLLHATLLDQCRKGRGYPVALQEAHERAVVTASDRRYFWALVQASLEEQGVGASSSEKARSKRVRAL